MEELLNKTEVRLGHFEASKPFQMAAGAQVKTVWAREKSEGVTVQPFAKTQKVKRSDYSVKQRDLSRGEASDPLHQPPKPFWHFLHYKFISPILQFHINGTYHVRAPFCLASFTQHNMFAIYPMLLCVSGVDLFCC